MENKEEKFEDKLLKLEELVRFLESGEVDLDQAIEKYSEAMHLAKECSDTLDQGKEQVSKILRENGLEDFTLES